MNECHLTIQGPCGPKRYNRQCDSFLIVETENAPIGPIPRFFYVM